MGATIMGLPVVGPSARDILLLPPRKLAMYAVYGSAAGIAFNIAMSQGMRYIHTVATKGKDITLHDFVSHPRLFFSALLRSGVVYGSAFGFEWAYANVPAVSSAVAGVVWILRRCVGLPGKAPYSEMSGGTPLVNVVSAFFEVERAYCLYLPIPNVGILGVNAMPLTSQQCFEVLGAAESEECESRFMTPTRLVRLGMQLCTGYGAIQLIRYLVRTKVLGWTCPVREQSVFPSAAAMPLSLLLSMAVMRDADHVFFLGFRVGLVGVFAAIVMPTVFLAEFAATSLRRSYIPAEDQMPSLAQEVVDELFSGFPVRFLHPNELVAIAESIANPMIFCALSGSTLRFAGALAVITGLVLVGSTPNGEPLTAYEQSLERLNANIGDEVMERQLSVASVDGASASEAETCPICLRAERPASQDMLRVKVCGHEFHTECLARWIMQSEECPLCRCTIERELPDGVKEKLEAFRALSEEETMLFLFNELCFRGTHMVARALASDATSDHQVQGLLNYLPKELMDILPSAQFFNIEPQGMQLLLGKMCEIWSIQQSSALTGVGALEDLAVFFVAPIVIETLLPPSLMFADTLQYMTPPGNVFQAVAQKIVIAMHLFP